jgi:WD40 repeat protein
MFTPALPAACLLLLFTLPAQGAEPAGKPAARVDCYGDPLPEGAVARLGAARFLHGVSVVSSLAFSPDGKLLFSTGMRDAKAWDAATGRPRAFSVPDGLDVEWLAFSPDGRLQACWEGGKAVVIQDAGTGKEVRRLAGKVGRAVAVSFSPDSKLFALADAGGTLVVWNLVTGQPVVHVGDRVSPVRCLAFSPDGRALAFGLDWDVRLCGPTEGVGMRRLAKVPEPVHFLAFPDPGTLVAASPLQVRVLDARTGDTRRELDVSFESSEGHHGHATIPFALSPDRAALAFGTTFHDLRLVGARDLRSVRSWRSRLGTASALAFSPDGRNLASAVDGFIYVWDPATGRRAEPFERHAGGISAVAFTPGGKRVATAASDDAVMVWDAATGRLVRRLGEGNPVGRYARASPDGRLLAVWGVEGCTLWNLDSGMLLHRLPPPIAEMAAFSASGDSVTFGWRVEPIRVCEVATGKELRQVTVGRVPGRARNPFVDAANAEALSPDARLLATTGGFALHVGSLHKGPVRIWDTATGKERCRLGEDLQTIRSVLFSPDSEFVATLDSMDRVHLWDAATGRQRRTVRAPGLHELLAFSPDGKTLACSATGRKLILSDLATLQPRRAFPVPDGDPLCAAFSPDGRLLVSGGRDGTALVWDVQGR